MWNSGTCINTPFFIKTKNPTFCLIYLLLLAIHPVYGSDLFDNHVRSMVYLDTPRELTVPVYVAGFGDPIRTTKRINVMYPPIDDNGYLCTLPNSILQLYNNRPPNVPIGTTTTSIALLVKYGGNCTDQQKAENVYEIQRFYRQVEFLLIYGTTPSPEEEIYGQEQSIILQPDTYPVSAMFDNMGILYIKYRDAIKVTTEMTRVINNSFSDSGSHNNTNQSMSTADFAAAEAAAHLMGQPVPSNKDDTTSATNVEEENPWSFQFFISGQPDDSSGSGGNSNTIYPNNNNYGYDNDNGPEHFFLFRFILFGLLIIAPLCRALYLWYMGGGRIYFRRSERTGRIIGLQYIPPIASWLAIGGIRVHQQSTTPIRETMSEEEFNNLPEIIYTEPLLLPLSSSSPPPAIAGPERKQDEQDDAVRSGSMLMHEDNMDGQLQRQKSLVLQNQIIASTANDNTIDDTLDASFNSAVEKGILSVGIDDTSRSNTVVDPIDSYSNNSVSPVAATTSSTVAIGLGSDHSNSNSNSNITPTSSSPAVTTTTTTAVNNTTTCTTCSICIDDFIIGETLTFLPRCKHAFHKSCIRPWLLERQGCCPLCKTAVLPDSENDIRDNSILAEDDEEVQEGDSPTNQEIDIGTQGSTAAAATTTTTTTTSVTNPTHRRSIR